jgi:nitrogen-specific signal transduction histidine kinase
MNEYRHPRRLATSQNMKSGDVPWVALETLRWAPETILITDRKLCIHWANEAALTHDKSAIGRSLDVFIQASHQFRDHYSEKNYEILRKDASELPYGQQQMSTDACSATDESSQQGLSIAWRQHRNAKDHYITLRIICRGRRWQDPGMTRMRKERQKWFTNRLAHEVRTPIAIARGYLRRAQSGLSDMEGDTQSCVQAAMQEIERLNRMFSNLALLTNAESDPMSLPIRPVSADELLSKWFTRIGNKGWERLHCSISGNPARYYVRANQKLFDAALENIIENAVKYDTSGQEIGLHIEIDSESVEICVADWGPGIPYDVAREIRVLEDPTQEDGSHLKLAGTGLGLVVAKKIMKQVGGNLRIAVRRAGDQQEIPSTIVMLTLRVVGETESRPAADSIKLMERLSKLDPKTKSHLRGCIRQQGEMVETYSLNNKQ